MNLACDGRWPSRRRAPPGKTASGPACKQIAFAESDRRLLDWPLRSTGTTEFVGIRSSIPVDAMPDYERPNVKPLAYH